MVENVQEAIGSGISASVKAVLHQLVDLALADEATERVGAGRHERTAERRAHRNGSYTRDLAPVCCVTSQSPNQSEMHLPRT